MINRDIFPKILFLVSILGLAIIGYYSLNANYLESEIEKEILLLDEKKIEYEKTISDLEKNKTIRIASYQKKELGSHPTCTQKWKVLGFIKIPIPNCKTNQNLGRATTTVKAPVFTEIENTAVLAKINDLQNKLADQNQRITSLYEKKEKAQHPFGFSKELVAAFFSFMILVSALFVVLSGKYKVASEKWAFGAVGTILGYWLG